MLVIMKMKSKELKLATLLKSHLWSSRYGSQNTLVIYLPKV